MRTLPNTSTGASEILLPSAPEIEARALGCLLAEPSQAIEWLQKLPIHYLHELRHREIHKAICQLVSECKFPEVVLVLQCLKDNGRMDHAGGLAYVSGLADSANPANFVNYAKELSEKAALRQCAGLADFLLKTVTAGKLDANTISDVREGVSRILDSQDREKSRLPEIEDCFASLQSPKPKPPEIVAGLLHQGTKLVLGGGSKSFKTWTLLYLALSVATGTQFLGLDAKQGRVLYVNFEIPTPFFQDRLSALIGAMGIKLQPGQLDHWPLRGRATDVDGLLAEFIQRTTGTQYALIVIDPLYKLLGSRDENAAGDMATLLNGFERIAVETGAAVAFGAHYSKGNQAGKESMDRISGSGVVARDPDSILTMTRHEQEGCFAIEPTLRNLPPMESFVVRWVFPLLQRTDLDPAKLKTKQGREVTHDPSEVLALLEDQSLTNKEWLEAALEEGVSKSTFYRARRTLVQSGRVLKSKANGKFAMVTQRKAA